MRRTTLFRRFIGFAAAGAIAFAMTACGDSSTGSEDGAIFLIRTVPEQQGGQTFRVLITDPAVIAEAEALVGEGNKKIVTAPVLRGDGGFNDPWSWHLDPDEVSFADLTTEVCDGTPQYVEDNLDSWLVEVGRFCPWSTEVVAREQ